MGMEIWKWLSGNAKFKMQISKIKGLMPFFVPEGNHIVEVVFRETLVRKASDGIYLVSFALVILFCFFRPGKV